MKKQSRSTDSKIVYSTDPSFKTGDSSAQPNTPGPGQQSLRILLDSRHRAGKVVTVIVGFEGKPDDLEALGKKLKTFCGSGGTVKDRNILIQGDHLEKAKQWLLKNGYKCK